MYVCMYCMYKILHSEGVSMPSSHSLGVPDCSLCDLSKLTTWQLTPCSGSSIGSFCHISLWLHSPVPSTRQGWPWRHTLSFGRMSTRSCGHGRQTRRLALPSGIQGRWNQKWALCHSTSTLCSPQHCCTGMSTPGIELGLCLLACSSTVAGSRPGR